MAACAYLGLGVMGGPMARHLLAAGRQVSVWNRTEEKAHAWARANGAEGAVKPIEQAVSGAEFVFMCLGDDPDVAEVFDRIEPHLQPGSILVDHTTGSAGLARTLYDRCKARGVSFIDGPVSGGQAGAESGKLTVMAGGDEAALERVRPHLDVYSRQVTLIGGPGDGQLAKSVNQICIAAAVQGVAEGLHFAERAGLDPAKVIEAISKGSAQSWQMENRWKTMVEGKFDFGFAVDWMRKDLRIALEAARHTGASTPVTALLDQFYADVQAEGGGRWDTSSLITRLNRPGSAESGE